METRRRFLEMVKHLALHHPNINIDDLQHGSNEEKAILSTIKQFANYDYNHKHKFFITDIKGTLFATENVELEDIKTVPDLFHAIEYLNQAYERRLKGMEETITLPEHLYSEIEKVQDISRENIMTFLQETYRLNSEKELLELEDQKQKEIIYDIYRNFTGFIPIKMSPGSIVFSVPEEPDLKFRYSDYPDFTNTTLFSHIRDMRNVNKSTKQMLKKTTTERIQQIKGLAEDKRKERTAELKDVNSKDNQDLER